MTPRPYFAPQHSHTHAKGFFKIYRKFEHAPSKSKSKSAGIANGTTTSATGPRR